MKKLLTLVCAMIIAAATFAQVDEVTLTVIGTGANEEQATLQALRSALEQAFGTFVSANTTIVNDQLIKDEIAATSKGNVSGYQKLSVIQLPDNTTSVTLKATVSVNKLITYARNNGSRAEFAGETYAMSMKLRKLQIQNAHKTLDVLESNIKALCSNVFDYDLSLGQISKKNFNVASYPYFDFRDYRNGKLSGKAEMKSAYLLPLCLKVYSTDVTTNIYSLVTQTFDALQLSSEEMRAFKNDQLECCSWHGWNLPVSIDTIMSISMHIAEAVLDDFLKVRIQKINDSEYYTFRPFQKERDVDDIYSLNIDRSDNGEYHIYADISPYKLWLLSSNYFKRRVVLDKKIDRKGINSIWYSYEDIYTHAKKVYIGNGSETLINNALMLSPSFLSKWNTKNGNQIQQTVLCSFPLAIVLAEDEIESFKGLEINRIPPSMDVSSVDASSSTNSPQVESKNFVFKKWKDLPSDVKSIKKIRVITENLPKKELQVKFEDNKKGYSYACTLSVSSSEIKLTKIFNSSTGGEPATSVVAGKEYEGYVEFSIYSRDCTLIDLPKELEDVILCGPFYE